MGNKIDLSDRQVPTEMAKNYALEFGLLFCEVSAKNGVNIQDVFTKIGTNALFVCKLLILKERK